MRYSRTNNRGRRPTLLLAFLAVGGAIICLNYLTSARAPGAVEASTAAAASAEALQAPAGIPDYQHDPEGARSFAKDLAQRTGGDFSKLTTDQKRMLDSMTAGHGAQMLRSLAEKAEAPSPTAARSPLPLSSP